MQSQVTGPRKSDKYIPLYFVAFFVVLFILDGIFVYLATSSHTGVVEKGTYNRGLAYNDTVAAAEAQEALGWQTGIEYGDAGMVTFSAKDAGGTPIEGAVVQAQFFRPTQDGQDFTQNLFEVSPGTYESAVTAAPGQWDVRIFVEWKQQRYQKTERIFVPKR